MALSHSPTLLLYRSIRLGPIFVWYQQTAKNQRIFTLHILYTFSITLLLTVYMQPLYTQPHNIKYGEYDRFFFSENHPKLIYSDGICQICLIAESRFLRLARTHALISRVVQGNCEASLRCLLIRNVFLSTEHYQYVSHQPLPSTKIDKSLGCQLLSLYH